MQVTFEQTKRVSVSQISSESKYNDVTLKQRNVSTSYNAMDIFNHQPDNDENFLGLKTSQDQGKTMDEIQTLASVIDMDTLQDKMVIMSNSVSEEDLGRLYEEGFHAGTTEVDEYVTIVDRIKLTEAKSGKVIAGYNDDLSNDVIENVVGDTALASVIKNALSKGGYTLTDEMAKKVDSAIHMCNELEPVTASTKKYLVENQLSPTVKNLFEAQFSGSMSGKQSNTQFELDQTGYVTKRNISNEISISTDEIATILKQNGIEINDETIKNGFFLNQEGIDITQKNMKYALEVDKLNLPLSKEETIHQIVRSIEEGIAVENADLSKETSIFLEAEQISERFLKVSEEGLKAIVKDNLPFTLQTLEALEKENLKMDGIDEKLKEEPLIDQLSQSFLTAKRQLEEARVYMTSKAGYTLLKAGVSIDTTEISKLVEALKYLEKRNANQLFKEVEDEKAIALEKSFTDSVKIMNELPGMPLAMVGIVITRKDNVSLQAYYEEGQKELHRMEMAKESYETYMTVIRTDLGDSIENAFSNLNEMLQEASIKVTDENIRAAKILGYNHLEITEETIETVKAADEKLQYVLNEMNPAMILQMLRDGKKPMEMEMDALLEEIDSYESSPETEHMRFSKFLYGLDQKKEITKEERKAFLEVYKVLKQVEKKNGAPLGALLATGAEFNLSNLKQASLASKKTMDYEVKNGEIEKNKFAREVRSISHKLSASVIENALFEKDKVEEITLEDLKKAILETDAKRETIDFAKSEQEIIEKASNVNEEWVQLLTELNLSVTPDYLVAIGRLKENRGDLYKELIQSAKSKEKETTDQSEEMDLSASFLEEIEQFDEDLSAETPLEETYQNFLSNLQDSLMKNMENAEGYIDLKQMMTCMKQVGILRAMEQKKEYEIPLMIHGELTSVHVTLEHEQSQKGNVSITTQLSTKEKVGACFYENDETVSGYVAVTQDTNTEEMEQVIEKMKEKLLEKKIDIQKIDIVRTKELDLNKIDQRKRTNQNGSSTKLYQVAKAFLTSL